MNYGNGTIKINPSKFKPANPKTVKRLIIVAVIVLIVAAFALTGFYTVNDQEVAVITTFGKVTGQTEAGIHFKVPFGVQEAECVAIHEIKKIEIGFRSTKDGSTYTVEDESKMITGDYNIVNVDFFVEYKISDAVKYLYSSDDPESVLKMLCQSQIRNVIGSYTIDPILTESKDQIQQEIRTLIVRELEQYDIGLTLVDIRIQDSQPPTDEVNEAFMAVKNAETDAMTALNNATAYKNKQDADAEAQVNKLIENATYLKQARINAAKEEVARFNAMFEQYALNKEITKTRIYYETLEAILPGVRIYVDTSTDGGVQKLLPLESLIDLGGVTTGSGVN